MPKKSIHVGLLLDAGLAFGCIYNSVITNRRRGIQRVTVEYMRYCGRHVVALVHPRSQCMILADCTRPKGSTNQAHNFDNKVSAYPLTFRGVGP
jgi:hypothetical protein